MNCSPEDPFEHTLPTVHEAVRRSRLIAALYEKIQILPSGAFPFASELLRLRDLIAPQIGDTRILFPEFTPHDEPLHVAKLFQLADKLFGAEIYKNLNASELFLLSAALYAHDWGMAVGKDEITFLRGGADQKLLRDTFAPLSDERERLNAFVRSNGLQSRNDGDFPELSDQCLRLYIRDTHARRSGARIRTHFVAFPAVGEALALLCEGHWHDFATLDDPDRFPREYEVANQTVNLLALSLQVRLIDLFHITDDRTPFALWRFVSPTDIRSAEEWKKHRALNGVTVTAFPPGRAIKVQGFTEDESVWAALQDLRHYCEDQIRQTLDISARHVPQRYGLDFLKLDWAVPTGQLRPVSFRFEFDRTAMFRILSDDIYDGDRYVFLRELLQNAIDAIRTRRARQLQPSKTDVRKKKATVTFDTTIYFSVEHRQNGDILVTCRDYGIGMDEHVIRNYFTVAGVSYYRSAEFERQRLGFEPISRFGIGILSCFMVADKLKVKTYRDPELGPAMAFADSLLPGAEEHRARRIGLEIPGIQRQFIVTDLNEDMSVGTEVQLEVMAQKVRSKLSTSAEVGSDIPVAGASKGPGFQRSLEVTEYLCSIAGFVEFPILVEEHLPEEQSPRITLILHPDRCPQEELTAFPEGVRVHQLSRAYPWDEVIDAYDVVSARELMSEQLFSLGEILGDEGYEGWVVFPKPTNETWDFTNRETLIAGDRCQTFWREPTTGEAPSPPLLWTRHDYKVRDVEASNPLFGIYRDGILLAGIKSVNVPSLSGQPFPPPLIRINLPSGTSPLPNVARSGFNAKRVEWDKPIWKAVAGSISAEITRALELPPVSRLFRLGWLGTIYRISPHIFDQMIPDSKLVSMWLVPGGTLELREGSLASGEEVPTVPEELMRSVSAVASKCFCHQPTSRDLAIDWEGPASLVLDLDFRCSVPFDGAFRASLSRVVARLSPLRMQFLEPPKGWALLMQQVVSIVGVAIPPKTYEQESENSGRMKRLQLMRDPVASDAVDAALSAPEQVTPEQLKLLTEIFPGSMNSLVPIAFSVPFEKCWAAKNDRINSRHDFGRGLIRCLAACVVAERDGRVGPDLMDAISRLLERHLFSTFDTSSDETFGLLALTGELFKLVIQKKLINGFIAPPIPLEEDLVPDVPNVLAPQIRIRHWMFSAESQTISGRCGKLITKWPIEGLNA